MKVKKHRWVLTGRSKAKEDRRAKRPHFQDLHWRCRRCGLVVVTTGKVTPDVLAWKGLDLDCNLSMARTVHEA